MKLSFVVKILVFGIIVLFLGVSIQPAFAVNISKSFSNNEDECTLCLQKISKSHIVLFYSLLNRLEKYNIRLSQLYKQYPEFEKNYQDLSESISTLRDKTKELKLDNKNQYPTTICKILGAIFVLYAALMMPVDPIYQYLYEKGRFLLAKIFSALAFIPFVILFPFVILWFKYCFYFPY